MLIFGQGLVLFEVVNPTEIPKFSAAYYSFKSSAPPKIGLKNPPAIITFKYPMTNGVKSPVGRKTIILGEF